MAGLKVTAHTAMRARDVSRPRESHLAEAELADGPDVMSDRRPGADGHRPAGSGDTEDGRADGGQGTSLRRANR